MKRSPILPPILFSLLAACGGTTGSTDLDLEDPNEVSSDNGETHDVDTDLVWNEGDVVDIVLNGDSIEIPSGTEDLVKVDGTVATIVAAGVYRAKGSLTDGQLVVDCADETMVQLILDGVDITNQSTAPIFVAEAYKVVLVLAEGSTNLLTDGGSYVFADGEDEPNAPLFSKDDLTVYGEGDGTGTLKIQANYQDGIVGKDGLVIDNASLEIVAADDGIRGKDYLVIHSGNISVEAGGDALRSSNDSDETLGYVQIDAGTFELTAGADGIQAVTDVVIEGGDFSITTGGGANANLGASDSAKALKAGAYLAVSGGSFLLDAADDALHSNHTLIVTGSDFAIATGENALHAEAMLSVQGGFIDISTCYEGVESAKIEIVDGEIRIVSSDDAINVAAGEDANGSRISADLLQIDGGYIYIDAAGDGVDVNANWIMNGGTVIVNGPVAQNNGALDYDGSFAMNGGFLVAAGSSGMAEAPSNSSSQASLKITYGTSSGGRPGGPGGGGSGSTFTAGTLIRIVADDGTDLLTFAPSKDWQSVVFSSPALSSGTSGTIYTGGTATGDALDGLYTDSSYSGGTERASFSISGSVTQVSFQ